MNRERQDIDRCEPFRSRLGAWLDRELPAGEQREMDSHLSACPGCRKVAEEYRTMAGWVRRSRGLESVVPPVEVFWQRLWSSLPERKKGWGFLRQTLQQWARQPRYQLALAGAIVLVILATVFLSDRRAAVEVPSGDATVAVDYEPMVESIETGVPGASVMVYHSEKENLTVVWLFTENTSGGSLPTPSERHI